MLARDLALLLCAAIAAYLVVTIALARLAGAAALQLQRQGAPWYLALAMAALFDLGKLVGLLPAAWVIRRAVTLRPWLAASLLVLMCYGIEVAVMAVLQQAAWSWARPEIWIMRLAALLLSIVPATWLMRRKIDRRATS